MLPIHHFMMESSWEAEVYVSVVDRLSAIDYKHGAIVGMEEHVSTESRYENADPDVVPCFACSK